jgi:hypothetical protein
MLEALTEEVGAAMARVVYIPDDFGNEIVAPSGYYQPHQEESIDYNGRRLLYTLGTACIEASCCGKGSWAYLRVEGYVVDSDSSQGRDGGTHLEVETIEDSGEKVAIGKLLSERHPGARIEFR